MKFINYFLIIAILLIIPVSVKASESNGTIESGNKTALVCHSVDCITPTPGIINFMPTGAVPVTIDDTNGIDGVAWGNEIGWINFDPTGAEGLIIDPSTGIISGKAWSQVSGWINFSATGQSVVVNSSGEFFGYAWTGGPYGGWIKFDCSFAGACVKTDWRPVGARSAVSNDSPTSTQTQRSGQTSSSPSNDTCPNLKGYQNSIPSNYKKDEGGLCLLDVDYCKNIEGVQLTIPSSHVLNGSGQCIFLTDENQYELIPQQSALLDVTKDQYDFCPNLFGMQSKLPTGFVMHVDECVPEDVDYCPNFLGNQYSIPQNMKVTNEGKCVRMTPAEIEENENEGIKDEKIWVYQYDFVPDFFGIQVAIPFFLSLFGKNYEIDLISLFITLNLIGLVMFFLKKL